MTTPEDATAQLSGNQVSSEIQPQQTSTIVEDSKGTGAEETQSYFTSEETLKSKINELTKIAETGNSEEITKAMDELGHIEDVLTRSKDQSVQPAEIETQSQKPHTETKPQEIPEKKPEETGDAKKFSVYWQGQKVEREDTNNLLGYKSTGDLKQALVKAQLRLDELNSHSSNLTNRLRDAEEKIKAYSQKPVQPQTQTPQQILQPSPQSSVTRPTPPKAPILSTSDPTLYTDEDISAVEEYQKATNDFHQKLLDYVASLENRPMQSNDLVKKELEKTDARLARIEKSQEVLDAEKRRLDEEKADFDHWKQFSDFQDRHPSLKTSIPLKQLNDVMGEWMDSVAAANGIKPPQNDSEYPEYSKRRSQVITNYLQNDSNTIQNAQGFKPPEDYLTFFKLLEINLARKKYKDRGLDADLHQSYVLMKDESGEIEQGLDTIRVDERTKAAEQFANGTQELQQHAVNIDPNQSAGGPDVNELGITSQDLKWFMSISAEKALDLKHKNREQFDKWNAIADRIEKKYAR